jgi:hypothetical protein
MRCEDTVSVWFGRRSENHLCIVQMSLEEKDDEEFVGNFRLPFP